MNEQMQWFVKLKKRERDMEPQQQHEKVQKVQKVQRDE